MTVATSVSRSGPYAGAGTTGPFAVTFRFLEDSHLSVIRTSAAGIETALALNVDFTVAGAGGSSGSLTLTDVLAVGEMLTIIRDVPLTQLTDYVAGDSFPADAHEDALDKLTMIAQQLEQGISGALRVPETAAELSMLPAVAGRASRMLGFDASGAPTVLVPEPGSAAAVLTDLASTAAGFGSDLVGFRESVGTPAYLKTLSDIANGSEVSLHRFLPIAEIPAIIARTSTYDCTSDLRVAGLAFGGNGGTIYVPRGKYFTLTGAMALEDNCTLRGDGDGSEIWTSADVEIITSANADADFVAGIQVRDLLLRCTKTSATTKYQVHLRNALLTRLERVHVISGLADLPGSATDLAGVWFDRKVAGSAGQGSYLNHVTRCFLQNAGLQLQGAVGGITDGTIDHNTIYGHACAHTIKFSGSSGNWNISHNQLSSPPASAAIWINTGLTDHLKIIGNFFDGNPGTLTPGHGIWSDAGAARVTVIGNQFWAMGKSAVRAVDPVAWSVTGNTFLDNNALDNFWPDVELVGSTFQPSKNVVSSNVFQQQAARVNAGFAILETNGGFAPVQNVYLGNTLTGNAAGYATGGISTMTAAVAGVQQSSQILNDGYGAELGNAGSWTPVIAGSSTAGTQTYSAAGTKGTWRRVGKIVYLEGSITLTAVDAATAGNLQITGLPFAASNATSAAPASLGIDYAAQFNYAYAQLALSIDKGAQFMRVFTFQNTVAGADVVAAALQATTELRFSGFYFID